MYISPHCWVFAHGKWTYFGGNYQAGSTGRDSNPPPRAAAQAQYNNSNNNNVQQNPFLSSSHPPPHVVMEPDGITCPLQEVCYLFFSLFGSNYPHQK
jgi:hypothetical protein